MTIDAHVHAFPAAIAHARSAAGEPYFESLYRDAQRIWSVEQARAALAGDPGLHGAVVVNWGWQTLEAAQSANAAFAQTIGDGGPVRWLAMAPPALGDAALREVEACKAAGAVGVGELMPDAQAPASWDGLADFCAGCGALDMPVLLHASEPVGHEYPGRGSATPDRLLGLIERCSMTTFVLAHFGGGLPFYAAMPRLARLFQRIWVDTAAAPFVYRPAVLRATVSLLGADRVVYGSDAPLVPSGRARRWIADAELDPADCERVLAGNALSVYRTQVSKNA